MTQVSVSPAVYWFFASAARCLPPILGDQDYRWREVRPILMLLIPWIRIPMTLCPIAIVAGCEKCPAFKICPLKGVIGDKPQAQAEAPSPAKPRAAAKKKKS